MFYAELEGEEEVRTAYAKAVRIIRDHAALGVREGMGEGAREARTKHAFRNRTGRLEASIGTLVLGWTSENKYEGLIRATMPYASFVEEGTKAHTITVRHAAWLHWESGGDHHFARMVRHPGTRPLPFMGLAYTKCERVVVRYIEQGIALAAATLEAA